MDVTLGLEAVHASGIIQRDVKSENILVFDHPHRKFIAKLGDFAFSKHDTEDRTIASRGTFPWQAPEVLKGRYMAFVDWTKADV